MSGEAITDVKEATATRFRTTRRDRGSLGGFPATNGTSGGVGQQHRSDGDNSRQYDWVSVDHGIGAAGGQMPVFVAG